MNDPFSARNWHVANNRTLTLGPKAVIMGVLNVTPDSFSDGGLYVCTQTAIAEALSMNAAGAQIIDVGGESTRPGADPVSAEEEQARILPVIEGLSRFPDLLISVDTYRAETAEKALRAGAHIVNDVWGFQKDRKLAIVARSHDAGVCAMHTGRERNRDRDVIRDQETFLKTSLDVLTQAGIGAECIVLDPGFGFAKDPEENIQLLARLEELNKLGFPLLIGTSRKRFIGHYTGQDTENRDIGTAATSVVARMKGASIFRVHDVASNRDALAMADAVVAANGIG